MRKDLLGRGIVSLSERFGHHPIKRKPIDKSTRDAVWIKYLGNKVEGKCYCCKIRTIHFTDFQVGHNKAVAKGGDNNISNLRPICGPCNRGMGTMSIEQYRKKYYGKKTQKSKKKIVRKRNVKTNPREAFGFPDMRIPKMRFPRRSF